MVVAYEVVRASGLRSPQASGLLNAGLRPVAPSGFSPPREPFRNDRTRIELNEFTPLRLFQTDLYFRGQGRSALPDGAAPERSNF